VPPGPVAGHVDEDVLAAVCAAHPEATHPCLDDDGGETHRRHHRQPLGEGGLDRLEVEMRRVAVGAWDGTDRIGDLEGLRGFLEPFS
jgi:hypothetical protein